MIWAPSSSRSCVEYSKPADGGGAVFAGGMLAVRQTARWGYGNTSASPICPLETDSRRVMGYMFFGFGSVTYFPLAVGYN